MIPIQHSTIIIGIKLHSNAHLKVLNFITFESIFSAGNTKSMEQEQVLELNARVLLT